MSGRLGEILVGAVLAGALWCWLQYGPWAGVRYQRRAAWLRPSVMRRVLRAARRKERLLDHEIRRFLRRAAPEPPGRTDRSGQQNADRNESNQSNESGEAGTLKRQQRQGGPSHRRPGRP